MVDEHDPRCIVKADPSLTSTDSVDRIKKLIQLTSTSRLFIQTFHNSNRHVSKYDDLVVIGDAAHSIYVCVWVLQNFFSWLINLDRSMVHTIRELPFYSLVLNSTSYT